MTDQSSRKARLAALAARAGRNQETKDDDDATSNNNEKNDKMEVDDNDDKNATSKKIKFRNYQPKDTSLEEGEDNKVDEKRRRRTAVAAAAHDDFTTTTKKPKLEEALQMAQAQLTIATTSTENHQQQMAFTKKINWDLKRDIQSSIDKLEKRTQRAIVQCLRERLEKEATEEVGDLD